ncbi:MAG: HDOD domain-containing protein [Opitutus sp.]|nr:HDOD domain-containing protein [Opitutus sp.]MCS6247155.1 HDOD domain-containing protein [Opitutus sp.]MCS6273849.1 HDOD domain-containing protein [Opitutus sp.]MCS6276954.1 HDOD domain-containing protein [Opitutus sp.]MCS6299998.1 HDOD domain-containing protein [Opitutus sp.]
MPIYSNSLHIGDVPLLTTTYEGLLSLTDSLNASGQILGLLNIAMRNPQITIPEVGQILRLDVVLSARIIRIANTAFYFKTTRSCNTIEEALQRVGLREIARLIATATMQGRSPVHLRAYGITGEQFNKSVRFNAFACQLIATEAKLDANLAYLSGLMRPLGILILNQWSAQHYTDVDKLAWRNVGTLLKWEEATFGLNHLEVSGFITREWGLPASVSDSLEKASAPFAAMKDYPLALVLQTAETLAEINRSTFQDHPNAASLNKDSLDALGIKPVKLIEISREALRQSQRFAA